MKYEITKISAATNRPDGKTKSFATTKELLSELSERNNGWLEGKGSIIEKNGVELFNTRQYLDCVINLEPGETMSVKKILSRAEMPEVEGR